MKHFSMAANSLLMTSISRLALTRIWMKKLTYGSQLRIDGLTHPNSVLDETLPYVSQQLVDAPSLPNNPNSDMDNTLSYGSQQFVDASEPLTFTCPSLTNLASSEPGNRDDDQALPIAIRPKWRPQKEGHFGSVTLEITINKSTGEETTK